MMTRNIVYFVLILFPGFFLCACTRSAVPEGGGNAPGQRSGGASVTGPPCIVYKTKRDYSRQVPVMLSEDRKSIVSYPGVKDIYVNGELAYPVKLEQGYLLDVRGIGPGVAFLRYTYESYSKLTQTPTAQELMSMILDDDPLIEMYACGPRSQYADPVEAVNSMIRSGKLGDNNRLK